MRKSIESIASVAEFKQDLKELSPESVRQIPLAARSWLRNNSHLEDKKWKIGSASLSHDSKLSPVVAADPIGHLQNPAADVGVDPQNAQTSSTQGALAMHIGTDALHNQGLNVPNNGENAPNIMEVEVIANPVPKSDSCGMSVSSLNTGGALELLDKDVEERLRTNVQETTMVMGLGPPPVPGAAVANGSNIWSWLVRAAHGAQCGAVRSEVRDTGGREEARGYRVWGPSLGLVTNNDVRTQAVCGLRWDRGVV